MAGGLRTQGLKPPLFFCCLMSRLKPRPTRLILETAPTPDGAIYGERLLLRGDTDITLSIKV